MARPWRSSRYIRSLLAANGVLPTSTCATPTVGARHTSAGPAVGAKTKQRATSTSPPNQNSSPASGASNPASDGAGSAACYVNPNIGRLRYSNAGALGADPFYRQTLLQTGTRALETVCDMSTIPMMEALHDEEQRAHQNQSGESDEQQERPRKRVQVEVIAEHENLDSLLRHNHSDPLDGQQFRAVGAHGETNGHLVNSTNLAGLKAQLQQHHLLGDVDASGSKYPHFDHHLLDDEDHVMDSENEACPLGSDQEHDEHDLPPSALPPNDAKRKEIERLLSTDTESSSARIFQHIQRKHADQEQQRRQRANTNPNGVHHLPESKQPRSHSPTPSPLPSIDKVRVGTRVSRPSGGATSTSEDDEDNPVHFNVSANRERIHADSGSHQSNTADLTGASS